MHGFKSANLAIFQKGLGWPCRVRAIVINIWSLNWKFFSHIHKQAKNKEYD